MCMKIKEGAMGPTGVPYWANYERPIHSPLEILQEGLYGESNTRSNNNRPEFGVFETRFASCEA